MTSNWAFPSLRCQRRKSLHTSWTSQLSCRSAHRSPVSRLASALGVTLALPSTVASLLLCLTILTSLLRLLALRAFLLLSLVFFLLSTLLTFLGFAFLLLISINTRLPLSLLLGVSLGILCSPLGLALLLQHLELFLKVLALFLAEQLWRQHLAVLPVP